MAIDARQSLKVVGDFAFRHWGIKIIALLLAAVLFVFTRDEVTRSFEVPLEVVADPDRVLLTDLPRTIRVKVRGPWTRINRLQRYDFKPANFDLHDAKEGPLEIDPASVVMPSGVVLAQVDYDHVDLRFEKVITRHVGVVPTVVGQPGTDYRLARVETDPPKWRVRGGESQVQAITQLGTEPLDVSGATRNVEEKLAVVRPSNDVTLVTSGDEAAQVDVTAVIEPVIDTREITVPVAVPPGLDRTGVIPPTHQVAVTGPRPLFRRLDELRVAFPVAATVVPIAGRTDDGGTLVEVRFSWTAGVSDDIREGLAFDHQVVRVSLPPPPDDPEPLAPAPGR